MSDLLRESPAGQLLRYFTKEKLFKYPEEKEGFQCSCSYAYFDTPETAFHPGSVLSTSATTPEAGANEKLEEASGPESESDQPPRLLTTDTALHSPSPVVVDGPQPISPASELLSRVTSRIDLENVTTRRDLERAYTEATLRSQVKTSPPQPIAPEKTTDGMILVDWYDTDDQENPQNWSFGKKCVVALQI
jgi:DHA1 family multidrug resistance protein-like MFS transporter